MIKPLLNRPLRPRSSACSSSTDRRSGPSSGKEGRARRHHQRASARIGQRLRDIHQVDHHQPRRVGRSLRHRTLRYRSKDLSQTAKSESGQPGASGDDVPRAHRGTEAADDVLLQGDLDRERWEERWGGEPDQPVHHTRPRRANRGFNTSSMAHLISSERHQVSRPGGWDQDLSAAIRLMRQLAGMPG